AVNAGLGWIGRQSLLISPKFGSFILLGEIVIDDIPDQYDTPYLDNGCKGCRRCIEACPASAINNDLTIDTRRCISCRTVEVENNSEVTLNGWIFGCDECQSCCPHNLKSPMHTNPDFDTIVSPPTRGEWEEMDEGRFIDLFGSTPLKRAGIERIKRSLE
ncbi:MAG: 4Fe-4S double cluster binding domain-containing protein, partial [Rikenellaceae bacterium]